MRLLLILLVLLPILLSLAESAPPLTKTNMKKGKQLVYISPTKHRAGPINAVNDEPEEEDDADDEDADDEEDADDDVDDDDDAAFDIPAFDKVFPNPDGRPVGPNSYDAFMRHKPGGQPSGGPAAQQGPAGAGQAGPRIAGQSGPAVAGHAGPGQRRTSPTAWRYALESDDFPYTFEDPTSSTEDLDNFYPRRDGRQGYTFNRVPTNYAYRQPVTYNRRNYVPYRRPVFYQPQMLATVSPNRFYNRPSSMYNPHRRTVVPVQMAYRPSPRPVYSGMVPRSPVFYPTRVGQARSGYNPWSWSPLRGDNYNPEYVVNPTEMLSRRRFRYHPSQTMPIQRVPLNDGNWGNPHNIQRDPWTGSQYHGGYLHSQI